MASNLQGGDEKMAIWNIDEIDRLSAEGKLRNLCRQLEQEAREWNRSFTYKGHKTSRGAQYIGNSRIKLITWGKGFKARGQVVVDGEAIHKPLSLANDAEQIYLELGAALDRQD